MWVPLGPATPSNSMSGFIMNPSQPRPARPARPVSYPRPGGQPSPLLLFIHLSLCPTAPGPGISNSLVQRGDLSRQDSLLSRSVLTLIHVRVVAAQCRPSTIHFKLVRTREASGGAGSLAALIGRRYHPDRRVSNVLQNKFLSRCNA